LLIGIITFVIIEALGIFVSNQEINDCTTAQEGVFERG
jgi:hypothetical protein